MLSELFVAFAMRIRSDATTERHWRSMQDHQRTDEHVWLTEYVEPIHSEREEIELAQDMILETLLSRSRRCSRCFDSFRCNTCGFSSVEWWSSRVHVDSSFGAVCKVNRHATVDRRPWWNQRTWLERQFAAEDQCWCAEETAQISLSLSGARENPIILVEGRHCISFICEDRRGSIVHRLYRGKAEEKLVAFDAHGGSLIFLSVARSSLTVSNALARCSRWVAHWMFGEWSRSVRLESIWAVFSTPSHDHSMRSFSVGEWTDADHWCWTRMVLMEVRLVFRPDFLEFSYFLILSEDFPFSAGLRLTLTSMFNHDIGTDYHLMVSLI